MKFSSYILGSSSSWRSQFGPSCLCSNFILTLTYKYVSKNV